MIMLDKQNNSNNIQELDLHPHKSFHTNFVHHSHSLVAAMILANCIDLTTLILTTHIILIIPLILNSSIHRTTCYNLTAPVILTTLILKILEVARIVGTMRIITANKTIRVIRPV